MRIRLTSIDEYQFLLCLEHGLWGSKNARFGDWQTGDYLGIIVDKAIAAVAQVNGQPFQAKQKIWTNSLYPHRIPIKFVSAALPENRPRVLGEIRDILTSEWGSNYGLGILNQSVIVGDSAEKLVRLVRSAPNDIQELNANLPEFKERALTKQIQKKSGVANHRVPPKISRRRGGVKARKDETAHDRIQHILKQLGLVTGCKVWIAANDRGRMVAKAILGDGCLKNLPNLGLNDDAKKRISLIDVLWIQKDAPLFAFEVEDTSSVYSGLLRMADLMAEVPTLRINFFIVAPADRKDKVLSELRRPTFRKIGLSDYCSYITYGELEDLLRRVQGLEGHVQPSIIRTIATGVESSEQ